MKESRRSDVLSFEVEMLDEQGDVLATGEILHKGLRDEQPPSTGCVLSLLDKFPKSTRE